MKDDETMHCGWRFKFASRSSAKRTERALAGLCSGQTGNADLRGDHIYPATHRLHPVADEIEDEPQRPAQQGDTVAHIVVVERLHSQIGAEEEENNDLLTRYATVREELGQNGLEMYVGQSNC